MKCANDNGFSVIRILQKDVYCNKYDWQDELMKNIEMLKDDTVINIYMCKIMNIIAFWTMTNFDFFALLTSRTNFQTRSHEIA